MFVVTRRAEILRFLLFLGLIALVIWYVAGRVSLWRLSQRAAQVAPASSTLPREAPAGLFAPEPPASSGRDYFAEYRIDRERTRGALAERLRELMESAGTADDVRQDASRQYLDLSRVAALESRSESMVRARGFDDVIVHLTGDSAQVVVKASAVSQAQFLQIVDTVSRITGVRSAAITVLAKEN